MSSPIDPRKIDPALNYSLEQVADFLNLSYGSVLKLKKNGSFQNIKRIGRRFYVPGKSILDYIQKG
jgi:hypothetical protein